MRNLRKIKSVIYADWLRNLRKTKSRLPGFTRKDGFNIL